MSLGGPNNPKILLVLNVFFYFDTSLPVHFDFHDLFPPSPFIMLRTSSQQSMWPGISWQEHFLGEKGERILSLKNLSTRL